MIDDESNDVSPSSHSSSPSEAVTVVLVVKDLIYGASFGEDDEEDIVVISETRGDGIIESKISIKYVSMSLGYFLMIAALSIVRRNETNLSLNVYRFAPITV